MFIEAITTCVGYADFLRETLPRNVGLFDHYLVVTSFDDRTTQALCRELSVECRPTDLFNKGDKGAFAKGRAIDWGMGYLEKRGWICQLDADIYLPPRSRQWIDASSPDEECIFGCDRVNVVGFDPWQAYAADSYSHHQLRQGCLLTPPPYPLGSRLVLPEHEGYVPIGFFTLWHAKHGRRYPLRNTTCEHTDVLHALQWPRDKRRLLEEVIAVHLMSEEGPMGQNWNGRRSKAFGPVFEIDEGRRGYYAR